MKFRIGSWIVTIERAEDKVAPAVLAKKQRARDAVIQAVRELRAEGVSDPTAYQVAKRAGVSPHTAKKYLTMRG